MSDGSNVKINDNIFVYWMYIWCMSIVIRHYIETADNTSLIPLHIDLVIIPNHVTNYNGEIGSIRNRLTSNKISYNTNNNKVICDPSNMHGLIQHFRSSIFE
eukprot:350592_1